MGANPVLIIGGLLVTLGLSGCATGPICTDDIKPAIEVTVQDAVSGSYLAVVPRGVVRDGAFQDSLRVWGSTAESPPRVVILAAADERRGVYSVQLEAEGYQPWDTAGVQVSRDDCHVHTAMFTANVEPLP
jgi:hypothetical protein